MNKVPNLDAMPLEDVKNFFKKYLCASRKDAEALIGDRRPGYTKITAILANYACNKSIAMRLRLEGDITGASGHEQACDRDYDRLPADLKW